MLHSEMFNIFHTPTCIYIYMLLYHRCINSCYKKKIQRTKSNYILDYVVQRKLYTGFTMMCLFIYKFISYVIVYNIV